MCFISRVLLTPACTLIIGHTSAVLRSRNACGRCQGILARLHLRTPPQLLSTPRYMPELTAIVAASVTLVTGHGRNINFRIFDWIKVLLHTWAFFFSVKQLYRVRAVFLPIALGVDTTLSWEMKWAVLISANLASIKRTWQTWWHCAASSVALLQPNGLNCSRARNHLSGSELHAKEALITIAKEAGKSR